MRVAVTGASGFVGGAVARALIAAGHTVRPFGRRDPAALERALPGYTAWDLTRHPHPMDVDAVVHCAAAVAPCGAEQMFAATNVHGTANVRGSVPRSTRFVYVSTASVYPHVRTADPIGERMSEGRRPDSPYARTKLAGERIARDLDANTVVLRPHIVYGPGDTTLWPRVVGARRGHTLLVPGSGENRVSVTHVDNLVHAVSRALDARTPPGVYNVADAESPPVGELLRTMFDRHALPTRLRFIPRGVAMAVAAGCELHWHAAETWRGSSSVATSRSREEPALTRFAVRGLADPCVLDLSCASARLGYAPRWSFRDGPL